MWRCLGLLLLAGCLAMAQPDLVLAPMAVYLPDRVMIYQEPEIELQTKVFIATAYTWTGNRTARETWPSRGTVAVDPRVVPLGTRMHIEGYGEAVAVDTGGAIKGYRLDLYMDGRKEALEWGRRQVEVTILD